MNRTGIPWADWSWNPITGCLNGCPYCYARKLAEGRLAHIYPNGFEPTFWPERLDEPGKVKRPGNVFVCSMGDIFGQGVMGGWIEAIFDAIAKYDHHNYLFLTKRPDLLRLDTQLVPKIPAGCWLGVTINRKDKKSIERLNWLGNAWDSNKILNVIYNFIPDYFNHKFISFEPLLGPVSGMVERWMDWIIIGAQTNPNVQPEREWVQDILNRADKFGIPVLMKHNLEWPAEDRRFEFPPELEKIRNG